MLKCIEASSRLNKTLSLARSLPLTAAHENVCVLYLIWFSIIRYIVCVCVCVCVCVLCVCV
jgi:hypothetical protein